MILKLMSSLLNCSTSNTAKPLRAEKGNGHFLTDMLKALHTSQKKSSCMLEEPAILRTSSNKIRMSSNKKGYKFYTQYRVYHFMTSCQSNSDLGVSINFLRLERKWDTDWTDRTDLHWYL